MLAVIEQNMFHLDLWEREVKVGGARRRPGKDICGQATYCGQLMSGLDLATTAD